MIEQPRDRHEVETMNAAYPGICQDCRQMLTSPAASIRSEDGRYLCAACYQMALLPGHRGFNAESIG